MACPAWCKEPDCSLAYGAHEWGFSIASAATPNRKGSQRVQQVDATEKRWDRDMSAYKALRADGLQPRRIDGCGDLQARANTDLEVSYGKPVAKKHARQASDLISEMKS